MLEAQEIHYMKKCVPILALACVIAAGCAKKQKSGDNALNVLNYFDMTMANSVDEINTVWDAFEKANPDITIIREDLFNDPFHNKVEAYAAAGQLPDVVYCWPSGRSTTLHTKHLLRDLAPFIKRDNLTEVMLPAALDPKAQGAGYVAMLPRAITATHVLYVNTAVLNAAGLTPAKTYAELKAQAPILKSKGLETVLIGNQDDWVMQSCFFSMLAGRFGGADWDEKILRGETKFTDADFVNALRFVKQLYDDGVLSKNTLTTDYGAVIGQFASDKGAYYVDGDWRIGAFITDKSTGQALIPPEKQSAILVTVFPDIEGAKINQSSSSVLGTGWGFTTSVPEGSPQEEAAWTLVKWLCGKEIQTWLLETGGLVTPSRTDIDTEVLNLEPLQKAGVALANEYSVGTHVIDGVFAAEVHIPINKGLQEIGMGIKTPQEVAQTVQRAFEAWKAKQ